MDRVGLRYNGFMERDPREIREFERCAGDSIMISNVSKERVTVVNANGASCSIPTFFVDELKFDGVISQDGRQVVIQQANQVSQELKSDKKNPGFVVSLEGYGAYDRRIFHVNLDILRQSVLNYREQTTRPEDIQLANKLIAHLDYLLKIREVTQENLSVLMKMLVELNGRAISASRMSATELNRIEKEMILPLLAVLEQSGKANEAAILKLEYEKIKNLPANADFDKKMNEFWLKATALLIQQSQSNVSELARLKAEADKVPGLLKQIADLTKERDELKKKADQLPQKEDEIKLLKQELNALKRVSPVDISIEKLENEIQTSRRDIASLEGEVLDAELEIAGKNGPINAQRRQTLQDEIERKNSRIKQLTKERDAKLTELEKLKKTRKDQS